MYIYIYAGQYTGFMILMIYGHQQIHIGNPDDPR